MRQKDGYVLSFFFLLNYYHIFLFICNFNTTDYFWAAVILFIRKYYIHISWKEGGKGWGGYGALSCGSTQTSVWVGEARRATVLQHHHNILHCHNITARWGGGEVCVSRGGVLKSPESEEERDQKRREGEREREREREGEGVVCQTLQLCGGF